MKKIYFLLPDYPNWFDGGLKYQTIVFNYFKSKSQDVYSFGKTVEVTKSRHKVLQLIFKSIHFLRIIIALYHILLIPRHSIIVLNNAFFLDYSVPVFFNRVWKKHLYVMIVHHLVQKDRSTYLRKKLESYFIKKADKLITVSNTSKNDLLNLSLANKKIPVIIPGLDIDKNTVNLDKKFPEIPKILFVGTIDIRKGLIYLVEALKYLKFEEFEVNCIGKIAYDNNFRMLNDKIEKCGLRNKFFFRGRVDSSLLKNFYKGSTVFVFPSLWEGYGMAVAEAMAYGLPVIASKIPALEEIVDDGVNGLLVEVGNSVKLADVLNTLLNDKALLENFSRNALAKSKTFLDWNDSSEKIWQFIYKNFNE